MNSPSASTFAVSVAVAILGAQFVVASDSVRAEPERASGSDTPLSRCETRMSPIFSAGAGIAAKNVADDTGAERPFGIGIRPREYDFTERLLNADADPLARDCERCAALPLALALRDTRMIERLLDKGCDANAALMQPIPQSLARLFDDERITRLFARDSQITPLMLAALTDQIDAVRLLRQHGADTQIHTAVWRLHPLDFAAERMNIPIMQLVLGREPDDEIRHIVVSLSTQRARLLKNGKVALTVPVSTGRPGYRTRQGEYVVTQKYRAWKSTVYKVPMPNFMRLNCGQTGLHAGYVPGVPASHGCIRLPPEQAAALYGIVQLGDRVSIVE
jgi:lipoprotein-anchoring transpeptidase ErfK/SrfK